MGGALAQRQIECLRKNHHILFWDIVHDIAKFVRSPFFQSRSAWTQCEIKGQTGQRNQTQISGYFRSGALAHCPR
jgi:hypothetical protein